jgi:hypothetical protein
VGLENVTFLPGSEANVIATAYALWSQEASTVFYESTGLLSAILAFATLITTAAYSYRELGPRRGEGRSIGKARTQA